MSETDPQADVYKLLASSAEEIALIGRYRWTERGPQLEIIDPPEDLPPGVHVFKLDRRPALAERDRRAARIRSANDERTAVQDSFGRWWSVPNERLSEPGAWNDFNPQTKGK